MRVFTLKFDPVAGTFDDSALTDFFSTNIALDATEYWFVHDGTPTLTRVIRYRDTTGGTSSHRVAVERAREPAIEVEPEHRAMFEALRNWTAPQRFPRSFASRLPRESMG